MLGNAPNPYGQMNPNMMGGSMGQMNNPMMPNPMNNPMMPNPMNNPMMPNQMNNPMMPNQMGMNNNSMNNLNFQLKARGQGIDQNEFDKIIGSSRNCLMSNQQPLSTATGNMIKQCLGGEWFVFVCPVGCRNFDFALTCVTGGDFLSFSLGNTLFQVCRLRN